MDHDSSSSDFSFVTKLAFERLEAVLFEDEVASIDGPHIVECRVEGTNIVSFAGPFTTGLQALIHADAEARNCHPDDEFVYRVFSILEPLDPPGKHRGPTDAPKP